MRTARVAWLALALAVGLILYGCHCLGQTAFDTFQFVPISSFYGCTNKELCGFDTNAMGAFILTWRTTNTVELQRSRDLVSWQTVWNPAPGYPSYSYGEYVYGGAMFYRLQPIQ